MDIPTLAGTAASVVVVGGFVVGLGRWFIISEVKGVKSEFYPNHGTSFRDHFDTRMDTQDERVNEMQQQLNAHAKELSRVKGLDGRLNQMEKEVSFLKGVDVGVNTEWVRRITPRLAETEGEGEGK